MIPESHLTDTEIDAAVKELKEQLKPLEEQYQGIERSARLRTRVAMLTGLTGLVGFLGGYIWLVSSAAPSDRPMPVPPLPLMHGAVAAHHECPWPLPTTWSLLTMVQTFWELSWDVMEPIAYFISIGVSIGRRRSAGLPPVCVCSNLRPRCLLPHHSAAFYLYFMTVGEEHSYKDMFTRLHDRYLGKLIRRRNFDEKKRAEILESLARYEKRAAIARFFRLAHRH